MRRPVSFAGLTLALALALLLPASAAQATAPGKNGRLAFVSPGGTAPPSVALINPDGTNRTTVGGTFGATGLAWAPASDRLAFVGTPADLYTVKVDGTRTTRIVQGASDPAWSPDGTKLAFTSSRDGNAEIYLANADGTGVSRLSNDPAKDYAPEWSPDGRSIAFISQRSGTGQVWVLPLTPNAAPQQVSTQGAAEGRLSWHPSGDRIAFVSDPGDYVDIFVARVPVPNPVVPDQRITFAGNDFAQEPAFSPDGQLLAYRGKGGLWSAPATGWKLDNPALTTPIPDTSGGRSPAWEVLRTQPPASSVLSFPATKRCASRRRFTIRIRQLKGYTYTKVQVYVNGKLTKTVKDGRVYAKVDLRGLPKGRFSVRIVVSLAGGGTVTGTRKYRTCVKRQKFGKIKL